MENKNTKKGIKGFIKGLKPQNTGKPAWNKGLACLLERCEKCGSFLSETKEHKCHNVDLRGDRFCECCDNKLRNKGWERYSKICGTCGKIIQRENERILTVELKLKLGGKCKHCGYNKEMSCLEFHHLFKEDKTSKHFLKQVLKNPERFELLCNRCHREEEIKLNENEKRKSELRKREILLKWGLIKSRRKSKNP